MIYTHTQIAFHLNAQMRNELLEALHERTSRARASLRRNGTTRVINYINFLNKAEPAVKLLTHDQS